MFSIVGRYLQYTRGCSVLRRDIINTVGDIISTAEDIISTEGDVISITENISYLQY